MTLAWQTGMFGKAVFCQEQITAGALKANEGGRQSYHDHLSGRAGVGKAGSCNPLFTRS